MVYLYSINLRFYHPSEKFPLNNLHHQFLSRSIDQLYLHSPDIEVCRCLSAVRCIFIPLPEPFADAIFYANVSFFCFFLGLQMQFDLPSKDNCILNLLILRLEDTFQRQIVSSIYIFLHLKILSADKWYLQTLKITIADTVLRESTEILICNTMRITIADTVLTHFSVNRIINTQKIPKKRRCSYGYFKYYS